MLKTSNQSMNSLLIRWIFIIYHICATFSNESDSKLLDIEDYQYHFKTHEYKFSIQPTYESIQYPLIGNNNNISITFEIDFNSTVSLLFDDILLDFFNLDDFTEITYTSSIQDNPSHRSLLNYYEPEIIKENPGSTRELEAEMNSKVQTMKKDLKKQMKEEKEKQEAIKEGKEYQKKVQNGEEETGELDKEQSEKKKQDKMKKKKKQQQQQSEESPDDKKNKKKRKKQSESEEDGVIHTVRKKEQKENPWRNHAFDGKKKKDFPSNKEWQQYRNFNKYNFPKGVNEDFDEYAKRRERALKKGGEYYDKLHGPNGDLPGHGPEELRKRYMQIKHKKPKIDHYPPPADEPRSEPYHHGKFIGIPERRSWFMAQQFCREQYGTNLASISDQKELLEVRYAMLCPPSFYELTGVDTHRHVCNQVAGYGHCWLGLHRPFGTWMDGKAVIYKNWEAHGVNNWHELPLNCVEMVYDDEKWHAQLCTVRRSFVCETPRSRTRGKFIAVGKALSWETAEKYCQRTYNSDLAVINTRKENRLAMNLCRDVSYDGHHCWIGLVSPFDLWSNGSPTGYRNFALPYMTSPDHMVRFMRREGPEPYDEDKNGNIIGYHNEIDHAEAVRHHKELTDEDKFKLAMLKLAKMERGKHSNHPRQHKKQQEEVHNDYADALQLGPNHASAPDELLENDETKPYRKKSKVNPENFEVPGGEDDDKLEKDLEKMGEELEDDQKPKKKKGKQAKQKEKEKMKDKSKSKSKSESKESKEKEKENESEETTVQTIETDEQNDQAELEGKMTDADEKQAADEYLADLEKTKQKYHERDPNGYAALHHHDKIPNDNCAAIETSYGGKWKKRRCSFRHYFLCNNPSQYGTTMHNNMMGMHGMSRYGMSPYGMHNGINSRYGNMNGMGMGMSLQNGMNGIYGANGLNGMNSNHRGMNGMLHQNGRAGMHGMNGMNPNYGTMNQMNGMGMPTQNGMHGMNQYGVHHRRRRLMDSDLDIDEKQVFLGSIMKKITGAVGGLFRKKRMKKRRNRRRERLEHEERLRRRRERRRRRIRRRRRFKRWLLRHYGHGHKRQCHGNCPYKHLHIRTLPEDMHWAPLSGVLPMFGVDGIHQHHIKKHHKPKIHIVAKVHLPKHREVDNGYLDYDLLSNLLFGESSNGGHKKQTLHDFNKREENVEKMISHQQNKNKDEAALMKMDHEHDGQAKYRRWDRINDRRADGDEEHRRLMVSEGDEYDVNGIEVVSRCKILRAYGCEICLKYYDNERMFGVDVKQFEKRELRETKRRIFRDVMDLNQKHYRDYKILDVSEDDDAVTDNGGHVLFEPIDGNLGYAIYKYEAFKNGQSDDEHVAVGQFDGFKDYTRFNADFEIIFHAESLDATQCGVTLTGLPFKLCLRDNTVFFERDNRNDILDASFSFLMKEFIDAEFEDSEFMLDDDANWDEINVINMGQFIEQCNYMHIAKVCVRKDGNSHIPISASIVFQYLNKIND